MFADPESITQVEADELTSWLKTVLGDRIAKAKVTKRLTSHPCAVTIPELGAVRHVLKTVLADRTKEEKYKALQATFEVNAS